MTAEPRPDLWPPLRRGAPASPTWRSAAFEADLAGWCAAVLDRDVRLEVVKVRCWSAVWRVHAEDGIYYVKQNCPGQAFEARLMRALGGLTQRVVPVTAVDLDRDFLMTPDQGPVLGETVGDGIEPWCAVAREAALLQREIAGHVDELEAAGARRLGAAEAASYVVTRVEQYAALPEGDPRRLDEATADRLRATLPEVERWAEVTLALGLPVTLNHSDLHQNNVFAHDGGMQFFDFGDSMLTDPLGVLLVTLNVLRRRLDCGPDDERLGRVADAALEVWSDLVPAKQLRQALPAALQLGRLGRVESWVRCQPSLPDHELAEWGPAAAAWLATLDADPPVGVTPR